ncbi:hypothetical protein [Mycobacteroides immunogenum]|nr:hypothetical protein [Mycobacteroides immunogenum]
MTATYDPLVVTLVVRDGHRMPLSRADRVAAVHEFTRMGKPAAEIGELLGISQRHVIRLRGTSLPPADDDPAVDYEFETDAEEVGAVAMGIVRAVRQRNPLEVLGACADLSAWHPAKTAQLLCALAAFVDPDEAPAVLARRAHVALERI